jgi:hypothetical protein
MSAGAPVRGVVFRVAQWLAADNQRAGVANHTVLLWLSGTYCLGALIGLVHTVVAVSAPGVSLATRYATHYHGQSRWRQYSEDFNVFLVAFLISLIPLCMSLLSMVAVARATTRHDA